jgi:O-antigen/teichoic acid export membrane protein
MHSKILLSFFAKIFITISGLVVYGVLARNLNENDYGLFALSVSIITVLSFVNSLGMHLSISKTFPNFLDKSVLKRYISISYLIGLFIISAIYFFLKKYPIFFEEFNRGFILEYLFLIIMISGAIRIRADYFRASKNYTKFLLYNSLSSGGGVFLWTIFLMAIFILLFFNTLTIDFIILSLLICCFITLIFPILFSRNLFKSFKKYVLQFKLFNFDEEYFSFLKSSLSLLFITVLSQYRTFFPLWFIALYLSPADAGYFFSSMKICSVILFPLSIIDIVFPAEISRLFKENKIDDLKSLVNKISIIRFVASFFIFSFIFVFDDQIITLIFGDNFLLIKEILYILIFYFVPQFIFGPTRMVLMMTKGVSYLRKYDLFSVLFSTMIYFYFSHDISLKSVSIIFASLSLINHLFYYLLTYKLIRINSFPNFFLLKKD